MIVTRRRALKVGGVSLATLLLGRPHGVGAAAVAEIRMQGRADGSHVWFDPVGIHIQSGQTVRWTNLDPGNSHTTTAYHPKFFDRPLRIPVDAEPWNSEYLLPDETFSATFRVEGVYDYYCVPHEHAGMVGRIVVGRPDASAVPSSAADEAGLPEIALAGFPTVEEIIANGIVRRK